MKKIFVLVLMIGVMAMSLGGCTKVSTQAGVKTIKIGVIAPLSGPGGTVGEDMITIYKMAVDEFNKTHAKENVELIIEDGKCSGKDATSATEKLIDIDNVDLIFGGSCSAEMIASSSITQPLKILNFSATASSPLISDIGDYVYRFYNDLDDVRFLCTYLLNNGVSSVGLIYENSDYATAYTKEFKKGFSGHILFEKKYDTNEKDFDLIIKSIQNDISNVQKIILIPQTDTSFISIMKSLHKYSHQKNIGENIIVSAIAWTNATFESIPDLIEGASSVMLPEYGILGKKSENFINDLKLNYKIKSNELYIVFFKESIDLILRAIAHGNYNSKDIKKYITSFDKNNLINGYRGTYYFSGSDTIGLKMIMQKIQSGSLVTIK